MNAADNNTRLFHSHMQSASSDLQTTVSPTIYMWHHRPVLPLESRVIRPLHVGAALAPQPLGALTDASGDNISAKNRTHSELTGIYWAWKNDTTSTHIGSFHYSRWLALAPVPYPRNEHNTITLPFLLPQRLEHYGLDEASVIRMCTAYDLIVTDETDVRMEGCATCRDQYAKHHHVEWYDLACDIADKQHPQLTPYLDRFSRQTHCSFFNMFIARRDVFSDMCEVVFDILDRVAPHVPEEMLRTRDKRLFGYISERLFNAYYAFLQGTRTDLKIARAPMLSVPPPERIHSVSPAVTRAKPGSTTIVFAADEGYSDPLTVSIGSLAKAADASRSYHVIILDSGLSARSRETIAATARAAGKQLEVQFLPIGELPKVDTVMFREQWSQATYNRLLLPELLPCMDRIIYLDCDTVVLEDPALLLDVPLGDSLIGAVMDIYATIFLRQDAHLALPNYVGGVRDYYARMITGGSTPPSLYQAGVMVMNLSAMRAANFTNRALDLYFTRNPMFGVDQDIFNVVCHDRIADLGFRWNVVNHSRDYLVRHRAFLSQEELAEIMLSREDPAIIHYTGAYEAKPFNSKSPEIPFAANFWRAAEKTPAHARLLHRAGNEGSKKKLRLPKPLRPYYRAAKAAVVAAKNAR